MILQGLKVPRSKPLLKMSRSSSLFAAHTGSQLKREERRQRGNTFLKDLYSFLYRQLDRDSPSTPTASATNTCLLLDLFAFPERLCAFPSQI